MPRTFRFHPFPHRIMRFLLCLFLISLVMRPGQADTPSQTAQQGQTAPTTPPADRTTLSYGPLSGGQMLIWVWLDGLTPARFVLDTGATYCFITDAMAAKIRLTPQPAFNKAGQPVTSDGAQAKTVIISELQVGTIRFLKIPMVAVKREALSEVSDASVDGVIGVMALTTYPTFIDFQKHQVTFFYKTPITPDQLRSLGMMDIPLYRRRQPAPCGLISAALPATTAD